MSAEVIQFPRIPQWSFGDKVRKIRRDVGLSQAEFAARIGVGSRRLASWEVGRNGAEDVVTVAQSIQREFGVPAAWVLGLDMETPRPDGPDGASGAKYTARDLNPEPAVSGWASLQLVAA